MNKKNIENLDQALEYLRNVSANWENWQNHHTCLIKSIRIILASVEMGELEKVKEAAND